MQTLLLDEIYNQLVYEERLNRMSKFAAHCSLIMTKLGFLTTEEKMYLWRKIDKKWPLETIQIYAKKFEQAKGKTEELQNLPTINQNVLNGYSIVSRIANLSNDFYVPIRRINGF